MRVEAGGTCRFPCRVGVFEIVMELELEKRGLGAWEKIVNFSKDEWFPSGLSFGKGGKW
jgi:hypothetical protein